MGGAFADFESVAPIQHWSGNTVKMHDFVGVGRCHLAESSHLTDKGGIKWLGLTDLAFPTVKNFKGDF